MSEQKLKIEEIKTVSEYIDALINFRKNICSYTQENGCKDCKYQKRLLGNPGFLSCENIYFLEEIE